MTKANRMPQLASAKRSGRWDAGCEFRTPEPIFILAVVLSCCGYSLRYWVAGVLGLHAVEYCRAAGMHWGTGILLNGAIRKLPILERIWTWQMGRVLFVPSH